MHGNERTEGAERGIAAITTGLGWVQVAETVVVDGQAEQGRRRGMLESGRDRRCSIDGVSRANRTGDAGVEPGCANRRIAQPRGRALGGTSAMNAMV